MEAYPTPTNTHSNEQLSPASDDTNRTTGELYRGSIPCPTFEEFYRREFGSLAPYIRDLANGDLFTFSYTVRRLYQAVVLRYNEYIVANFTVTTSLGADRTYNDPLGIIDEELGHRGGYIDYNPCYHHYNPYKVVYHPVEPPPQRLAPATLHQRGKLYR